MKTQEKNLVTRIAISLLICIVIVFWGLQVSAEEWTEEQKEVWKTVETNWETMKLGDVEEVMALGAEGSIAWWTGKRLPRSGYALKAGYRRWFNYDKPVSYELIPFKISIFGDVANVFYLFKWKGNVLSDTVKQMSTFIKQNNKWKFIGSMGCSCEKAIKCP